ncbi:DUF500-domain-containing protein [Rhizoclosmatium globosum]|uniref:DUF500-domain-containing protein n=1 Tax=Rhizoclosmatium globosum TaxID=329046 RepID=A0A1Y2CAA6_9FUNG|nr:DUF500-domain-containing protein [Rhizoclosmatium globosum]|eukprot:ORY43963.1 DUF500-domain-containing protein [Rhizoclosmatium globosum]
MTQLAVDSAKAAKILEAFRTDHGTMIPDSILKNAKGVAILDVFKAGIGISGRHGSGVVVARLPNGSWSAPSAIETTSIGFGSQFGAQVTEFVIILNDDEAVDSFKKAHNFTAGGNLSVAAGPFGAAVEAGGQVNNKVIAPIYSYSRSQGLFAGASLEFGAISANKEVNLEAYGAGITSEQILEGFVPRPEYATQLYWVLDKTVSNEGITAPAQKKQDEE